MENGRYVESVLILMKKVSPMRKVACSLIPLLAFLLSIPSASAQEKKYRFEFFGGASYPIKEEFEITYPQSTTPIQGTQRFSLGVQGGIRFGLEGARHWGQDYTYSYGQNPGKLETPYGQFSYTSRFHHASTTVLFYPWTYNTHQVSPYVAAGIGAMWSTLKHDAVSEAIDPLRAGLGPLKTETVCAFHAGGGLRFRLSERLGMRIDLRDTMSRTLRWGLPETSDDPNATVLPVNGVFHQISGSFGVVIHF